MESDTKASIVITQRSESAFRRARETIGDRPSARRASWALGNASWNWLMTRLGQRYAIGSTGDDLGGGSHSPFVGRAARHPTSDTRWLEARICRSAAIQDWPREALPVSQFWRMCAKLGIQMLTSEVP